ncbi:patatin-like phospholipase family protein [Rhodanobacter sp. MP1X3]|uniref:patatin-like phospholipase family protein n=1 Tax=Rhodanobacter sp. MP1X3 TaxID=2723086 RepID=UPI00161D319B|nr:patatin-like phospholipase family protein [Rhodanobacter sp. MP1X3]MBB6241091.1 putative acylesterase/phospholipase RssA [Rhodanobacter sp. MP1X3]
MPKVEEVQRYAFADVQTLVFAGGGNRCWWQAGALRHLMERGMRLPTQLIGTSAGAAVAASFLTGSSDVALATCLRLYAENARIFSWSGLSSLKLKFAHQHVYPAWLEAFINTTTFDAIRDSSSRLTVALTRPAKLLGMGGSIAAGTLAYLVDKYLWNSIHPRLPKMFGLRQDFVVLNECAGVEEAQSLLIAAASAPPIMSSRTIGKSRAIDGGYTDNAPIPQQSVDEKSKTLVLLTRHYPQLPRLFLFAGRTYWQPSQRVPVSTWDCTAKTTVREACDLGLQDAVYALSTGLIC